MMTLSETWYDLFGLAGLLNPFALLIGGYLGWKADRLQKLWIAGFAAAALTLILDVAIGALPVPQPLRMTPVRWLSFHSALSAV